MSEVDPPVGPDVAERLEAVGVEPLDAAGRPEDAEDPCVEVAGFAAEADAGAPAVTDGALPDAAEDAAVAGEVSSDREPVRPALPAPPVVVPASLGLVPGTFVSSRRTNGR